MAEIKKVPAIRFKGFSENWDEDRFGNRLDIENGYAFKSIYFQDEPNRLIVLTPGNVHIGGGFQKDKGRYYSEAGEIPSRFILKPNDIFVTMTDLTPTAQTLGYPAVVPSDGNTYLLNQRLGKIVNFEGDKNFLLQILCTEKNHKQIVSNATGTTVKHSSPQKILSVLNHFPSKIEQTQIGSYFQNLDKLISLHQTKVNKLTNLKKAMLEKMFPKQGADVPEIRFKGFAGAWDEKSLGDEVAEIVGGGTPNTFEPTYWNGDIDWYSPTEIGTKVFADGSVKKITELGLQNSSAKLLPANKTILFTSRAGIGDMAILRRIGATNQGFQSMVLKDGYDPYFIYSMGYLIKDYAIKYSSGSTFLEISGKILGRMVIKVPSLTEQEKIGTYFHNLDKTITLHQTELEKLTNLKKACLEKMFV